MKFQFGYFKDGQEIEALGLPIEATPQTVEVLYWLLVAMGMPEELDDGVYFAVDPK